MNVDLGRTPHFIWSIGAEHLCIRQFDIQNPFVRIHIMDLIYQAVISMGTEMFGANFRHFYVILEYLQLVLNTKAGLRMNATESMHVNWFQMTLHILIMHI